MERIEKLDKAKELLKQWAVQKEIAKELQMSLRDVNKINKELKNQELSKQEIQKLELIKDLTPKQIQEILYHNAIATKDEIIKTIWEPWYLRFWLVSDTHFWSKTSAKDELWEFYDRAKDKWVECFIHAWDLVDWDGVYKWQTYELEKIWFDAQLDDVVENYPNVWLDTYFVQWNHDESFLKKTWWDIGRAISLIRRDLVNLWFYDARIKLNWVDINVHHWGGGQSYARSYKPQKLLENIDPKDQPNLFTSWHRHTALYMFYRKIHTFLPWAFMKENLLSKRFHLDNTIGGWIIEIEIDENGGSKIGMEFLHIK